jgi:hypothetical protein
MWTRWTAATNPTTQIGHSGSGREEGRDRERVLLVTDRGNLLGKVDNLSSLSIDAAIILT